MSLSSAEYRRDFDRRKRSNRKKKDYTLDEIPKILSDLVERGFNPDTFIFKVIYEVARTKYER
jgi:hypothetical protein